MKTTLTAVFLAATALCLVSCTPTALNPGAQKVYVGYDKPAKNCTYVGQVTGGQGGTFAGSFTANKDLMQGSMNDLRNKAYQLGGNYVVIVSKHDQNVTGTTGSGFKTTDYHRRHEDTFGAYQQTSKSELREILMTGNVYRCPN